MGTSGVNMACAETGHITTVSNEGNIRMATTLPRVHVAFMGMERIVARLDEYEIILRAAVPGAAAQSMGTYVSYIGGPAPAGGSGRTGRASPGDRRQRPQAGSSPTRSSGRCLCCVRCAPCLNVCPVYAKIGGHAYGFAYSGPVGAVVTPLLTGINRAKRPVLRGDPLRGLHGRLLDEHRPAAHAARSAGEARLRRPAVASRTGQPWPRDWPIGPGHGSSAIAVSTSSGSSWQLSGRKLLPSKKGMIRRLPPPVQGWTQSRDLHPLAEETFMERLAEKKVRRNRQFMNGHP